MKNKNEARARLHALAQQAYKARKALANAKTDTDRNKADKKIFEANIEAGKIRAEFGIQERQNSIQKKAQERSKEIKGGIVNEFEFYQTGDVRKNVAGLINSGNIKSINGIDVSKNPVKALSQMNLVLSAAGSNAGGTYRIIKTLLNPETGEYIVSVGFEGDEDEDNEY